MDKPIFVDYESKICSAYLNTVAVTVWDALGQAQTPSEARQFIGAVEEAPSDGGLYLRSNMQWVSALTSLQHNDLAGRSTPDAHPISAITGLQNQLDSIGNSDAAQDAAIALKVDKTSNTGAAIIPTGPTSQRPTGGSAVEGLFRRNSEIKQWEGFDGANWTGIGGASGGGGNPFCYENDITVTVDYTITTGKNAHSAGPITVQNGVTVTIPNGSVYTVS